MTFSPLERLILELAYNAGLLRNEKYELFAALTNHTRKQISVWNAHRNEKQRKKAYIDQENLTQDKQTQILQRAWSAGFLGNPKYYDEIAKITQKTRKQVCVWCAHRREKIKKEAIKKKRKTDGNYFPKKRQKTEHEGTDTGIDADGVSILRTALQGRVLNSRENIAMVSCLVGVDFELVNRWVKDQSSLSVSSATLVRA